MSRPCDGSGARRRSALILSPEAPYPAVGGGALRTASLVEYLARRYTLDLIIFHEPGAPDPREAFPPALARRIDVLELPRHSRSALARAGRNLVRFARGVPPLNDRFAGHQRALARLVAGRAYDFALIEHSWCAPYAEQLGAVSRRVGLDLHNIESVLAARTAEAEGPLAALLFRRFAEASAALERRWLPRFALTLATSEQDAARCRVLAPTADVLVYPNAIPLRPLPAPQKEEAIVFSGNLEYHPNRAAVKFFARQVWPKLRARWPRLKWRLIGKNPQSVRGFLGEDPRIELTGPVEDAIEELARARVGVAPMLSGSGTRVKILEAWAAGLPVVSTAIGAEGLDARDGEHLMLAETADEIREAVSALLDSPGRREEMGGAARRLFESNYTWEAAWSKLDEAGLGPGVVK
ncbi:MAG: glycosyltransferase [Bryobacterales bacterium]|nr:glycosyltransferase [Bryobacterales bacterium]